MTLEGTVVNGTVVLDPGGCLPEGARVRLEVLPDQPGDQPPTPTGRGQVLASFRAGEAVELEEAFAQVAGVSKDEWAARVAAHRRPPTTPTAG